MLAGTLIHLAQVNAAADRLSQVKEECQRHGAFTIAPSDLVTADEEITKLRALIREDRGPIVFRWWGILQFGLLTALRGARAATAVFSQQWYVPAVITGGVTFVVVLILMAIVTGRELLLLGISGIAFVLGFAFFVALYFYPFSGVIELELAVRKAARRSQVARIRSNKEQLRTALAQRRRLEELLDLQAEHEEARAAHDRVLRLYQDTKNQLQLRDWRAMRGPELEQFLAEVLTVLGYQVQMTKATGDQGIDLIATRATMRLAIQVKGYVNSVGNSAVQEAFSGMTYYRCNACAVITNSVFTQGAYDLATTTSCRLIDGSQIPALIRGELL